jgi:hypothetical protein
VSDDLQTDLKRFDADHYYKPEHWKRIAEAARQYANPNIQAAHSVRHGKPPNVPSSCGCITDTEQIVAAALHE